MKLVVRAAAAVELGQAFRWYETQHEGLGDELLRAVETVLQDLLEDPERHPKIHGDIRRALVRRFPYAVFYRVLESRIVVVAVFHGRRDPTVWRRRR